ncbi:MULTISPECIES: C40 family peptidase [Streptomyces]|uniref:C40 family peptidase n=1 Tax=Streptomyces TaxID=1883 RepID=UPI00216AC8E9|nr:MULTISPECIES: C40 family peptidase [Streptomyces]
MADPGRPSTLTEVQAEIRRLYHDAEVATEKYNAVDERLTRQRERVRELNAQIKAAEAKLADLRTKAGAAARAQYRTGGLPAEVNFVLAGDPDNALDSVSRAWQAQRSTSNLITALTTTRQTAHDLRDGVAAEVKRSEVSRQSLRTQRKRIEERIADAKETEARLSSEQRRELAALDQEEAAKAQAKWVDAGNLQHTSPEVGPAGRKAIAFATAQIGKPYVWGAEGPDAFDCSGLTSQAWLHAGVTIPRTSQEQWRRLKHVPIGRMRAGDLVIYFSDASHVGLYIGDGKIIQAPRPGRNVYVSPVASMEILGAVRPEA